MNPRTLKSQEGQRTKVGNALTMKAQHRLLSPQNKKSRLEELTSTAGPFSADVQVLAKPKFLKKVKVNERATQPDNPFFATNHLESLLIEQSDENLVDEHELKTSSQLHEEALHSRQPSVSSPQPISRQKIQLMYPNFQLANDVNERKDTRQMHRQFRPPKKPARANVI